MNKQKHIFFPRIYKKDDSMNYNKKQRNINKISFVYN